MSPIVIAIVMLVAATGIQLFFQRFIISPFVEM
jgi:hypothetical protein